MSLSDILDMGRYGPYVWSCFVLTALVLVGNVLAARRQAAVEVERARRRAAAMSHERAPVTGEGA